MPPPPVSEDTKHALALPGMTRCFGDPCDALMPTTRLSDIPTRKERKVILLATATITKDNVFSNGLFQNVFVFYQMFEAMGYNPILIIHEKPASRESLPVVVRDCRMMLSEEIIMKPLPVVALIELGMSIDPLLREFVKMLGGKLTKVYLGNILNIDAETPIFYPNMHFAHHVIEKIDRAWVSPHYGQNAEYAAFINHVLPPEDIKDSIAPYVWDPCFLTNGGTEEPPRWKPATAGQDAPFVIMEPNISFQKCSLIPLLSLERWYRAKGKAAGWKGKVIVVNGDRLVSTPHFVNSILPTLTLADDDRVEFTDRKSILVAMRSWPTATFVGHQFNNEYNYMTLELMYCGFPIVHNSHSWGSFGYYYEGNDLRSAAIQIDAAWSSHAERYEAYRSHARTLAWRHSPYNPDVHRAWEEQLKK